jgi:hypothetical protein
VSVVSNKHLETASMLPVPPILKHWLTPFTAFFTRPTWERVLVLAAGTVLAPGRRTVSAALSVLGRREGAGATHEIIQPEERACTRHSRRPACAAPAC